MTRFAQALAYELWRVWCVSQWPVATVEQMDDWGHKADHPEFRLDIRNNYISHVPHDKRGIAQAMQLARDWNMTPQMVYDMPLAEFHEQAMIHKAITLKKPKWEGWRGALEYKRWIIESRAKWQHPNGPMLTDLEIDSRPY